MTATFRTRPDGLGGRFVCVDDRTIGRVFPVVVADPDAGWYGKPAGVPARRFPTPEAALAFVSGQPTQLEENR